MSYVKDQITDLDVVTVEETKEFIRVTTSDEDELIKSLIAAATSMAERYMNLDILTTTWINYRPSFFDDLTLTRGKFRSVTLVEQLVNGVYESIPDTEYVVTIGGSFGVVCEISPPETSDIDCNAVKITFTTGFGPTASFVPEDIKTAIKMLVSWMYNNRGDCDSSSGKIPVVASSIFRNYRIINLIGGSRVVCV